MIYMPQSYRFNVGDRVISHADNSSRDYEYEITVVLMRGKWQYLAKDMSARQSSGSSWTTNWKQPSVT